MIHAKHISKSFTSQSGSVIDVLADFSLEIPRGQIVTILGPTGCGKTTLLNIIAGLLSPDAGEVFLPKGISFGCNIGYVMQHYTLLPWLNLMKNVTFPLKMRGMPRRERTDQARRLLESVELAGFETSYPHELSGGMRQRAAIAQALAIQPGLLLMDEPFGALDDLTRRQLQKMLLDLWRREKITILFVTHNIDEAISLGNRVAVLSRRPGRIVEEIEIPIPHAQRQAKRCDDVFEKIKQLLDV